MERNGEILLVRTERLVEMGGCACAKYHRECEQIRTGAVRSLDSVTVDALR